MKARDQYGKEKRREGNRTERKCKIWESRNMFESRCVFKCVETEKDEVSDV